jgi:hypothetical protein
MAAALVFGLGLGNHPLTGLLAFGIAPFLFVVDPQLWRRPGLILGCAALLVIGLGTYLYIPIRAAMRLTRPAASAIETPLMRFIRYATLPNGSWLHAQPSSVYVGKPVGWKIDSVCGTVWASPVSQNPTPGSIVRR